MRVPGRARGRAAPTSAPAARGRFLPPESRTLRPVENAPRRSFASDNNAPAAPEILQALIEANSGDAVGYGEDPWTARAIERFKEHFGARTDVYFTFNGTGANVAAL